MVVDMKTGNPTKLMLRFAFPMLMGNIFQQLYNMVDSIVVGRFIGKDALAAVGSSFSLMNFITLVIIGLCIGSSIVISLYFGAEDYDNLKRTISTSFIFMLLLTIFISAITLIFAEKLLILIQTPDEILADSTTYLRIIFGGLIFIFLYNGSAALLRALGDSKTPLYFLILASIINIVLDLLFVIKFNMGVPELHMLPLLLKPRPLYYASYIHLSKYPCSKCLKKNLFLIKTISNYNEI